MAIHKYPSCHIHGAMRHGQTQCLLCLIERQGQEQLQKQQQKKQQQAQAQQEARNAKQAKADRRKQAQASTKIGRKPPRVVNPPSNGKTTAWRNVAGVVGFLLFGAMALAAGSPDPSVPVAIVFAVVGGAIFSKLYKLFWGAVAFCLFVAAMSVIATP